MREPIRVVLVDDHPLWRQGVAATLTAEADFEVVGQGSSAADAVSLVSDLLPDVVLLDISMAGGGVQAARTLAMTYPVVKLIMLTVSQDEEDVLAALKAGAQGYVLKGVSATELVQIVRDVYNGGTYITPTLATSLLLDSGETAADPLAELTPREREILERVAEGHSNKVIAADLGLREKTVKHYMTNVLQKLHVRNRVEAALLARNVLEGNNPLRG